MHFNIILLIFQQACCIYPGMWVYHLPAREVSAVLESGMKMDSEKINCTAEVRRKTKNDLSVSGKSDSPTERRVSALARRSITGCSLHARSGCSLFLWPQKTSCCCMWTHLKPFGQPQGNILKLWIKIIFKLWCCLIRKHSDNLRNRDPQSF